MNTNYSKKFNNYSNNSIINKKDINSIIKTSNIEYNFQNMKNESLQLNNNKLNSISEPRKYENQNSSNSSVVLKNSFFITEKNNDKKINETFLDRSDEDDANENILKTIFDEESVVINIPSTHFYENNQNNKEPNLINRTAFDNSFIQIPPTSTLSTGVQISELKDYHVKTDFCNSDFKIDDSTDYIRNVFLDIDKLKKLTRTNDLNEVKSINLSADTRMRSLSNFGLHLPNLEILKFTNSIIPNIRNIGCSLKNLKVLHISHCGVKDLDGLLSLINLTELYMANNDINDISLFSLLEQLKILDIGGNNIDDISQIFFLKFCSNLINLNIEGNPLCIRPNRDFDTTDNKYDYKEEILEVLTNLEMLDNILVNKKTKVNIKADIKKNLDFESSLLQNILNKSDKINEILKKPIKHNIDIGNEQKEEISNILVSLNALTKEVNIKSQTNFQKDNHFIDMFNLHGDTQNLNEKHRNAIDSEIKNSLLKSNSNKQVILSESIELFSEISIMNDLKDEKLRKDEIINLKKSKFDNFQPDKLFTYPNKNIIDKKKNIIQNCYLDTNTSNNVNINLKLESEENKQCKKDKLEAYDEFKEDWKLLADLENEGFDIGRRNIKNSRICSARIGTSRIPISHNQRPTTAFGRILVTNVDNCGPITTPRYRKYDSNEGDINLINTINDLTHKSFGSDFNLDLLNEEEEISDVLTKGPLMCGNLSKALRCKKIQEIENELQPENEYKNNKLNRFFMEDQLNKIAKLDEFQSIQDLKDFEDDRLIEEVNRFKLRQEIKSIKNSSDGNQNSESDEYSDDEDLGEDKFKDNIRMDSNETTKSEEAKSEHMDEAKIFESDDIDQFDFDNFNSPNIEDKVNINNLINPDITSNNLTKKKISSLLPENLQENLKEGFNYFFGNSHFIETKTIKNQKVFLKNNKNKMILDKNNLNKDDKILEVTNDDDYKIISETSLKKNSSKKGQLINHKKACHNLTSIVNKNNINIEIQKKRKRLKYNVADNNKDIINENKDSITVKMDDKTNLKTLKNENIDSLQSHKDLSNLKITENEPSFSKNSLKPTIKKLNNAKFSAISNKKTKEAFFEKSRSTISKSSQHKKLNSFDYVQLKNNAVIDTISESNLSRPNFPEPIIINTTLIQLEQVLIKK